MKKYIFMAVAGMLALSSCSNDDNDIQDVQNAPRQMTFTAGYNEGAQTRATLNGSTKKVSFDANDKISILSAKNTNTQFTTSAGGASADFTGTATDDSKFYAVYPYTSGLTLSGDVISGVTIPTDQWNSVWSEYNSNGGWDSSAPIAYATTTDASLTFHNLCAILKIKLGGGFFGGVQISANQSLAGTFSLNTSTGALTATSGSTTVTAGSWSDNSKFIGFYEKYIYIAIAPGTYTNFKVYVQEEGEGLKQEKTKSSVTFAAGKIYDLGTFEEPM